MFKSTPFPKLFISMFQRHDIVLCRNQAHFLLKVDHLHIRYIRRYKLEITNVKIVL